MPKGIFLRKKEIGQKISKSKMGHTVSDEVRKKISESLKGKPSWNKGIPMSEEARKKLSLSTNGKRNNTLEQLQEFKVSYLK